MRFSFFILTAVCASLRFVDLAHDHRPGAVAAGLRLGRHDLARGETVSPVGGIPSQHEAQFVKQKLPSILSIIHTSLL